MTPRWGYNPWCNAPIYTSLQEAQNRWPVRFTWAQMMDAFFNVKSYNFSFITTDSVGNMAMQTATAMSMVSMTGVAGLGVAVAALTLSATRRTSVTGTTDRHLDTSLCTGVRHHYNHNLCLLLMDFWDVYREAIGNGWVYRPRVLFLAYASGMVWSNDESLLAPGSGVTIVEGIGAIDVGGSSGAIDRVYAAMESSYLVESPYIFGSITPNERFDGIGITPTSAAVGATVTATGVNFTGVTSVEFGGASAVIAGNGLSLTVPVPAGATCDPLVFVTATDRFTSPEIFKPL